MGMYLVIDGERVGEIEEFQIDKPPQVAHWGPIFVHQRAPPANTCTFKIAGAPSQQGIWVVIVGDEGEPIYEVKLLHVNTAMGLGASVSTVKAKLL